MSDTSHESLLRLPAVLERVGLSRSSIYLLMRRGDFPPSCRLTGEKSVAWRASEVDQFIASRPNTQVLM